MQPSASAPPLTISFSPAEIAHITRLSEARNLPKMRAGVPNYRIDPAQSDARIQFLGLKAEVAAAKALGLTINTEMSLGGDNGNADLVTPSGETIEVKYRGAVGWHYTLLNDNLALFTTDIGVVVWPATRAALRDEPMLVAGWFTRADFLTLHHIQDFGYGRRACLAHAFMRPISELIDQIGKERAA